MWFGNVNIIVLKSETIHRKKKFTIGFLPIGNHFQLQLGIKLFPECVNWC